MRFSSPCWSSFLIPTSLSGSGRWLWRCCTPSAINQTCSGESAISQTCSGESAISQTCSGESAISQTCSGESAISQTCSGESAISQTCSGESAISQTCSGESTLNPWSRGPLPLLQTQLGQIQFCNLDTIRNAALCLSLPFDTVWSEWTVHLSTIQGFHCMCT